MIEETLADRLRKMAEKIIKEIKEKLEEEDQEIFNPNSQPENK